MSADKSRHDTLRLSRLTQEKTCEGMTLPQLFSELSSLQCVLTNVTEEYRDRRETIDLLTARIDIVRSFIAEKIGV